MIKKFKNGKINLSIKEDLKSGYYEKTVESIENFYHDVMFMQDLYINNIDGYNYIVDNNTNKIYDLPCNNFIGFLEKLLTGDTIELIAYSEEIGKKLIKSIEE